MTGRLYVCPIVGTGVEDDPQRPAIADAAGVTAWRACIATDGRGKPSRAWSICWVTATSWTAVDGTAGAFHLTADALNGSVTARVTNALVGRSVLTAAQLAALPTLRDVADTLVKRHYGHSSLTETFPEVA